MAKRRPVRPGAQRDQDEEEPRETPDERRARRERERRARQKGSSKAARPFAAWPGWKKGAVFGGAAIAVVAVVAVVLLFVVKPPCLALAAPPASSGVPDQSAPSWCVNSSVAMEQRLAVKLTIIVGGTTVTIPGGIGEISKAKAASEWGFSNGCTMPVFTDNSSGPSGSDSGGVVQIASPWPFTYTISDFFNMWKESFSTVSINGNPEPVSYTGTQVFNYSSTANQVVRLWVDNQVSSAGTGLVLNYLSSDYQSSNAVPQCLLQQYGSGHTIAITWGWVGAGLFTQGPTLHQAAGSTASSGPGGPHDPALAAGTGGAGSHALALMLAPFLPLAMAPVVDRGPPPG